MPSTRFFVAAIAIVVVLAGPTAPSAEGPTRPSVIVLGDSQSSGWGTAEPYHWMTIFAERLDAKLDNLAQPSVTSQDAIDQHFSWPSGRTQSQLDEAIALLRESENVAAVVVQFGMGDYFALRDPGSGRFCYVADTYSCDLLLARATLDLEANLSRIVGDIQAAAEDGTAVALWTYFPAYYGSTPILYGDCRTGLNDVISHVAEAQGALLADVCPYFPVERSAMLHEDGIHPSIAGHAVIADVISNVLPPDSDEDGLNDLMEAVLGSDVEAVDSDNDGCTDGDEFGPLAREGGRRDPTSFWDFFDTPPRDGAVTMSDVFRVISRFGTSGSPAIDASSTPPATGYHTAFDRRAPGAYEDAWDAGPPDGTITMADILLIVGQFAHACR